MSARYKATEEFWKKFYALPPAQKASVRAAFELFKKDPFDPRLGTHKIHLLSVRAGYAVYSVVIEANLRVLFCRQGESVITLDIGTHDLYR